MAHWQHTLDIKDIWQQGHARTISAADLAAGIAARKRRLPIADDLDDIIIQFKDIAEHDGDFTDIDVVYGDLCDWGDDGHRLWIRTII